MSNSKTTTISCTIPTSMQAHMATLAEKQGVSAAKLQAKILIQWYEDNFQACWSFWNIFGNQGEAK
jgi:hypothetical protein